MIPSRHDLIHNTILNTTRHIKKNVLLIKMLNLIADNPMQRTISHQNKNIHDSEAENTAKYACTLSKFKIM